MGKRWNKRHPSGLRAGDFVARPDAVRNLPPYCSVGQDDDGETCVVPDWRTAVEDYHSGELANYADLPEGYRGLALEVNDHGNVTLLRVFKNGNTREVWGVV